MAALLSRSLQRAPAGLAAVLQQAACGSASSGQLVQLSAFASSAAAASGKLLGACVLERLPVVFPYPPEWEMEYAAWRRQLHAKQYKVLPKEFTDPKQSEELAAAEGAAGRWQPADRITDADRSGDRRALRRRLDQILFLLVRPRGKADVEWTFPQAENAEGESMRQTAERALAEGVSLEGVQPFFVGNAPAGHHVAAKGGDTLFFHRCQLIQGKPALKSGGPWGDHAWVAKDELPEYIKSPELLALLQKML